MNNKQVLLDELQELNLTKDEAKLYIALIEKPNTHLRLARITGINRTKVYRIVEELEKRGLVSRRTDDRGTFLIASDPDALEIELAAEEGKIRQRRALLQQLVPDLRSLYREAKSPLAVHTYEGVEGFKQMQWNELKTRGELLVLGNVTVEQLVKNRRWSEHFRERVVERGYTTRELINRTYADPTFSEIEGFMNSYSARIIPEAELPISTPVVIYNDTVAVYQFNGEKRVGAEIINATYAETMRSIFEHYWRIAEEESGE